MTWLIHPQISCFILQYTNTDPNEIHDFLGYGGLTKLEHCSYCTDDFYYCYDCWTGEKYKPCIHY